MSSSLLTYTSRSVSSRVWMMRDAHTLIQRFIHVNDRVCLCLRAQVSRSVCVMTTQLICKLLRSKEASAAVDVRTWPPVLDTGTHARAQTHAHTDLNARVAERESTLR